MQKVQQATSGKGRGLNGMPTPAQIQALQRAMPPGMLQQMQRQLRSGGGMPEMMKAMMQGQGGDQLDMEEMQRTSNLPLEIGFSVHDHDEQV
jgi:signal recognition particle subunit SRP54